MTTQARSGKAKTGLSGDIIRQAGMEAFVKLSPRCATSAAVASKARSRPCVTMAASRARSIWPTVWPVPATGEASVARCGLSHAAATMA